MLTEKRKKEFASLHRRRNRDRLDAFVIEGVLSVDTAIQAGADVICLLSTPSAASEERSRKVKALGGEVEILPERELSRMSDVETSQGVLLIARKNASAAAQLYPCSSVLILDGVQDPGNVGSLIRTAAWFGVDAVLAGPGTADFHNSKTVRASMGGIWDLLLAQTMDLTEWISEWKAGGGTSWAADLQGTAVDDGWSPAFPSALIIGSEAHGIAPDLLELADGRVHIPAHDSTRITESLNASVAGGLLVSAWMRKGGP